MARAGDLEVDTVLPLELGRLDPAPALALLAAYVLFAAVVTPVAGAAAIRNAQG